MLQRRIRPRIQIRLRTRTRPRIRSAATSTVALALAAIAAAPGTAQAVGPRLVMLPGATMPLGLPGFGDIVADDAAHSVFLSSGAAGGGVEKVDYTGVVSATLNHERGADGMVLSADGKTLYVALITGDAVVAIDTATFTEKARYALPAHSCPTNLARTGPDVWIGYGCASESESESEPQSASGTVGVGAGVAVLATDAASPKVVLGKQDTKAGVRYSTAPILAAGESSVSGATPGELVVSQPGQIANDLTVYATTAGAAPSLTLIRSVRRGGGELADLAVSTASASASGTALGAASGVAPGTASGVASGTASDTASGAAAGTASGVAFAASGSQDTVDAFTTPGLAAAGQYQSGLGPDALALSADGTELAATTSIPESPVYVWRVGTAAPIGDYTLPLAGAPAPRGLAFSGDGSMLFLVTEPTSGLGAPTLQVLRLQ